MLYRQLRVLSHYPLTSPEPPSAAAPRFSFSSLHPKPTTQQGKILIGESGTLTERSCPSSDFTPFAAKACFCFPRCMREQLIPHFRLGWIGVSVNKCGHFCWTAMAEPQNVTAYRKGTCVWQRWDRQRCPGVCISSRDTGVKHPQAAQGFFGVGTLPPGLDGAEWFHHLLSPSQSPAVYFNERSSCAIENLCKPLASCLEHD